MFNIGLMGTLVSNENLGCVALTYSLMKMLQDISHELNTEFSYTIFDFSYDEEKYKKLEQFFNLPKGRVSYAPIGYCYMQNWKLMIKKTKLNLQMLHRIHKCDLVIDLTQGDSFTDIYGIERFLRLTVIKEIVVKKRIPLILGPQTYGPFQDKWVQKKAKSIIERADVVVSRDEKSKEVINQFSDRKVFVTTDLAMALPYNKTHIQSNKIKIGINPSGLLISDKTENTKLHSQLKADYDRYIYELIKTYSSDENYEVHLIPHVGCDAVEKFSEISGVICHGAFNSPIEAKNCIASMDVFVGSRMHATIAAFSSGVATIPVAYSRKFSGLYYALGYEYVVDLCTADTDDALNTTYRMINNYRELKQEVDQCQELIREKNDQFQAILLTAIQSKL